MVLARRTPERQFRSLRPVGRPHALHAQIAIAQRTDKARNIRSMDSDIVEHLVIHRLKVEYHAASLQLLAHPPEKNREDGAVHLSLALPNGGIDHFARDVY
ncbi:hypothetical protein NHG85_13475 [Limimaricola sp. ASW11-118]|uniref:Uncharacterized protein n=1 Tax=Limimaricola litoreus TaxID=2955316 RepID=A0A9X2FPX4_9RHOB|nr:hypothetical protein [Limimaricola litoreus]